MDRGRSSRKLSQNFLVQGADPDRAAQLRVDDSTPDRERVLLRASVLVSGQPSVPTACHSGYRGRVRELSTQGFRAVCREQCRRQRRVSGNCQSGTPDVCVPENTVQSRCRVPNNVQSEIPRKRVDVALGRSQRWYAPARRRPGAWNP